MLKSAPHSAENDVGTKRRFQRTFPNKRTQSASPIARARSPLKKQGERKSHSLSPSSHSVKKINTNEDEEVVSTLQEELDLQKCEHIDYGTDKEPVVPHCIVSKMLRVIATKKREFIKMRKSLITQQNSLLDQYAQLKDLETRAGVAQDDTIGEMRLLSVTGWPAHDLLLLVREDLEVPLTSEICGVFGPHVLQQMNGQLNPIPEEVLSMCAEIMARRIDLLGFMRSKHRGDRSTYLTNLEWKTRNTEFDNETEKLHRMVAGAAENLKAKINYAMELAKIPWVDRDTIVKKYERLHKENMILQHKMEDTMKKDNQDGKCPGAQSSEGKNTYQDLLEELGKERAARDALKEVVSAAESMLRVARARIATLERMNKEIKNDLEAAKKKHRDLEQLYRHRETSYDARSRKLLEVSKTGEMTIDALSRQRDALEIRVRELREQAESAENSMSAREIEQQSRTDSLQAKVAEQEKIRAAQQARVLELEAKVKELEETLQGMRERSVRLVDMDRRRCLDHVPTKENEPSDRETELWKELQVTRVSLARAEEEVRQSKADKDSFLNSLSRIAQGEGPDNLQNKIASELVDREQKIGKLKRVIEEQRENEKLMEQSMTAYENQLASLRLEVRRLRNYDCYAKELSYEQLQTELLELHMQVDTLTRERTALVTAAASRALMLERHERAADLFARVVRTRRELVAIMEGRAELPAIEDNSHAEISRSLSSLHATAADTWSALRVERARVLRLESAVLAQSIQLEREGRVRTQLERRRAMLEREILRSHHSRASPDLSRKLPCQCLERMTTQECCPKALFGNEWCAHNFLQTSAHVILSSRHLKFIVELFMVVIL